MYSKFIPGAILYSIKSLPDVISELEDVAKTAISNDIAYQKLVTSLLARLQSDCIKPPAQHKQRSMTHM